MTGCLDLRNFDVVDEGEPVEGNPNLGGQWATHGCNLLVGNGGVTDVNKCGHYRGRFGCLDTEVHKKALKLLGKEEVDDMVYHRPVFYSCHSPLCPRCFMSWARREASKIDGRLAEASKLYGLVEHIIASIPLERYGLDFDELRVLTVKALRRRGVIGGTMIFHGFRWNQYRLLWYWSPHWHVLGFIEGGYVCRDCKKVCFKGCGGFVDRSYRCFETDGFIVKIAEDRFGVKGVRRSIYSTAKYQLSHASIRTDSKRAHAVFWFGVCSYRRLKFKYVSEKASCPLCRSVGVDNGLVRLVYYGSKYFCTDRNSSVFVSEHCNCLYEDGRVVFEKLVSGSSAVRRRLGEEPVYQIIRD